MSDKKRRVLLIDDMYSSNEEFWRAHGKAAEEIFNKRYELVVFNYKKDTPYELEKTRIQQFLGVESTKAHVLLLDVMFPGEDKGGLEILKFVQREKFDIPVIIIVSSSQDQSIALEIEGIPFVHREKYLDAERLVKKFDELFMEEKLYHPEKGVLISHGTDTLAYIVEFLRYGIKEISAINIIVTGSQISMGVPGSASDAIDNIRSSVLLLQHLFAPEIGVVFNRGEEFFRSNIQKISKWHPQAFYGVPDVHLDWDRFTTTSKSLRIHFNPNPLNELILFRTGGTIESVFERRRGYVPGGDFISSFITGNLANCYLSFKSIPFSALDSSNICIQDWLRLLNRISKECQISVDTRFEPRIGLVLPTPFTTTEDYFHWMERFEGIVIAGYGAGNANIIREQKYMYSLLKAVDKYVKKHPVVLASHVPCEKTDFAYEVGNKFIQSGCIPSGHLSFQASLVRLSYLMGNRELFGQNYLDRIRELFVQGLEFRSETSTRECEKILTYFRLKQKNNRLTLEKFYDDFDNQKITNIASVQKRDVVQMFDLNKLSR